MFRRISFELQRYQQPTNNASIATTPIEPTMKFTVQTNNPRLTAKAISSIDCFEEIESMLPTAQEMLDDLSHISGNMDDKTGFRRSSMDNLNELLQMLEKDSVCAKAAAIRRPREE